jgi:5-methylcytosine-specific restriction endonuclease McrA
MNRALLLNASFEALAVVSSRRALLLVLEEKAELVHATGRVVRSPSRAFPEPSVVRLERFVRVPYQARLSLNRRAVFARDGYRCQYCGAAAENLDHVVPRSRGGGHTWDNVVACCRACNARKEDRLVHESGLTLRRAPFQPRERIWVLAGGVVRQEWAPYLNSATSGVEEPVHLGARPPGGPPGARAVAEPRRSTGSRASSPGPRAPVGPAEEPPGRREPTARPAAAS